MIYNLLVFSLFRLKPSGLEVFPSIDTYTAMSCQEIIHHTPRPTSVMNHDTEWDVKL